MKEMIYILPFSINVIELVTIFIGIYHYKKYKNTFLKYFLWFLCYGFFTEMVGFVVSDISKKQNFIVFNIYALIQFLFFLWLFYKYYKTPVYKTLIKFMWGVILLFFIINTLFFQDIYVTYQSYFFLIGGVFLLISVILFFIEILNSEAILKIKHLPIFWVAVGIMLFQLGFIPVFLATKYINYSNGLTYGYILLILNFITSLCYSLGFIWSKKNLDY